MKLINPLNARATCLLVLRNPKKYSQHIRTSIHAYTHTLSRYTLYSMQMMHVIVTYIKKTNTNIQNM